MNDLPKLGMTYRDADNITPLANEKHYITINQGLYGYQVSVGCQHLSVSTSEEAIKIVSYYLANPKECIKAYAENRLEELVNTVLKG